MPHIGVPELLIVLVIVVLVFGVGRLSEVGSALGKSIREFRKATSDKGDEAEKPEKKES
jgi:sec-independent protein translocase protein TatA